MSATNSKALALIGFAVKAGKTIYGADNILKSGKVKLIICCPTLAENTLKRLLAQKTPSCVLNTPLEDAVGKTGVKAVGITDRQMSEAIFAYMNK